MVLGVPILKHFRVNQKRKKQLELKLQHLHLSILIQILARIRKYFIKKMVKRKLSRAYMRSLPIPYAIARDILKLIYDLNLQDQICLLLL